MRLGLQPQMQVLCDNCKNPVVESGSYANNESNLSWEERWSRMTRDYHLSPRMWPFGYLIESSYSPLRLEREHPERNWRDAVEDLLAPESRGKLISHESRQEENAAAAKIGWDRASFCISRLNKWIERDSKFDLSLTRIPSFRCAE